MTRPRDSQISKVLAAEAVVRSGLRDEDTAALLALGTKVVNAPSYQDRAAKAGKTIAGFTCSSFRRGVCQPWLSGRVVCVSCSPGRATRLDILHALAHMVTPDDVPLHGPEWAKIHLELTQEFLGMMRRNVLRDAYKAGGVKWRTWSPEAREAAKKRAAERGTPFAPKVSREEQQEDLVAMLRDLAGLPPEAEPDDPIDAMLKAAKKKTR